MRFKAVPCRKKYNKFEWHRIFAWRPRKVLLSPKLAPEGYLPPHQYVWMEFLERKWNKDTPDVVWDYRFCAKEGEKDEQQ